MVWDPNQYLRFAGPRLQPALDLLARVQVDNPKTIYDLGCGTGHITALIQARWPEAAVVGLDSSAEMLEKAQAEHPGLRWEQRDVAAWSPDAPADLIFSNAALQWLGDHATLLPRLLAQVAPGGQLAVQMPRNYEAPSHRLIRETRDSDPWREMLRGTRADEPTHPPQVYYDLLASRAASLALWETEYCQVLEGENPVAEFTKGSWLKSLLDVLDEPHKSEFEAEYRRRVKAAYPPQPDGKTLFPFRRLFILATA